MIMQTRTPIPTKKILSRLTSACRSNSTAVQAHYSNHDCRGEYPTNLYQSSVCECMKRTGAAMCESIRRERPDRLMSPVFHACGRASPFRTRHAAVVVIKTCRIITPNEINRILCVCMRLKARLAVRVSLLPRPARATPA